jgi:hypothetical protein
VSERVSETIILCEDDTHCRLVKAYMKECGLNTIEPTCRTKIASRMVQGGNVKWVLNQFPIELAAVRARNTRARTLLIVVADADEGNVADRIAEFHRASPITGDDSLVLLIPRRNMETWILFAVTPSNIVNEEDDYKKSNKSFDKSLFRAAAKQIHGWAHDIPVLTLDNVPSLVASLHEWRRIARSGG